MVKRPSLLLLCSSPILLAFACSSSTPSQRAPSTAASPPPVATAPVPEPIYARDEPRAPAPIEEKVDSSEAAPAGATSQSATFAADSSSKQVEATLKTVGKSAKEVGSLQFAAENGSVTISGKMENLPAGTHGIKILESKSCDSIGGKVSDFNPTKAKHGPLDSAERHVGDLGNINVNKSGETTFELTTDSLTVAPDGASSVLGHVVVVTRNKDDGKSQPDGRAGKPIACGKIAASSSR